jgi:hypothetical protein
MCDWFEVRLRIFPSIFSQIKEREAKLRSCTFCTVTDLKPKRDNELGKRTKERFLVKRISAHGGCLGTDRR